MATVIDLSGNTAAIADPTLVGVSRTNAGTPVAALTPAFVGEIVYDSTNKLYYKGTGTTANTQWRLFNMDR